MTRRDFNRAASVMAAAAVVGRTRSASAQRITGTDGHPNVLVIFCDQLRYDFLACTGRASVHTPHLDRLFARGTSFARSYSASAICTPARGSWLTGMMPAEHGAISNNRDLHPSRPNFGQVFREAGYDTVHCGKWHLAETYQADIPGFATYPVGWAGQGDLVDIDVARLTSAFLEQRRDGDAPFLAVASFMQPHDICLFTREHRDKVVPNDADLEAMPDLDGDLPANLRTRFPEAPKAINRMVRPNVFTEAQWRWYRHIYDRQIEMLDHDVGVLLETLNRTGLAEDTLVVFTSDHGEGAGDHGTTGKWHPWESSVHVPMLFALPGQVPQGRVDDKTLVSGIDLLPTLCDYAGIDAPEGLTHSRSVRPRIEDDDAPWRDALIIDYYQIGRIVLQDRHKLVVFPEAPNPLLFDLVADPEETRNIADGNAQTVDDLNAALTQWEQALDPVPRMPIRHYPNRVVPDRWNPHRGWG
ncbi:MAG: sulfatase-like hydrolase/transferase [Planctomycetota bacterium]